MLTSCIDLNLSALAVSHNLPQLLEVSLGYHRDGLI